MFFSVVIPSVNYKNLLKASKSLNNQNFKDFEIILIIYQYQENKNKIDEYLKEIFKSYLNIKTVNIDVLNVSKARNLGVQKSNAEWICFLDDDDFWFDQKLQKINKFIKQNNECKFLFHDVNIRKNDKVVTNQSKRVGHFINLNQNLIIDFNDFKHHNFVITSSVVLKKNIIEKNIFDENLQIAEDWDLWLRLTQKHSLYYVHELLGEYHINPKSVTSDLKKYEKNNLKFYNKHREIFSKVEFNNSIKTMYFLIFLGLLKERKIDYKFLFRIIRIIKINTLLKKTLKYCINKLK